MTFIPHYGSYKDLTDLYELVHTDEMYTCELKRMGQQSCHNPSCLIWEDCKSMTKRLSIKNSVELFAHALEKDIKNLMTIIKQPMFHWQHGGFLKKVVHWLNLPVQTPRAVLQSA